MAEKVAAEQIPQMSFKKMGCDPKDAIRAGKTVFLCRIFGEASEVKTKESRGGDMYSFLLGEFGAATAEGKSFESSKLFLPGSILEVVEAALKTAGGSAIQFGYDIFASPADNSIGYQYAAKTIMKTEASDRLAAIAKELEAKPMPKVEPKEEKKK